MKPLILVLFLLACATSYANRSTPLELSNAPQYVWSHCTDSSTIEIDVFYHQQSTCYEIRCDMTDEAQTKCFDYHPYEVQGQNYQLNQ